MHCHYSTSLPHEQGLRLLSRHWARTPAKRTSITGSSWEAGLPALLIFTPNGMMSISRHQPQRRGKRRARARDASLRDPGRLTEARRGPSPVTCTRRRWFPSAYSPRPEENSAADRQPICRRAAIRNKSKPEQPLPREYT